jgi:L-threonylcarbamoyladenylate synthase
MKAPPDRGASSFIYPPTPGNLSFFTEALEAGCVVAIPTETVYGLAGLALDEAACRSIFSIKGRPLVDPLIVHVSSLAMADSLAEVPREFIRVADTLWPGPLTVILKKKPAVPDLITAGKPTVALRMPQHPVARELLIRLNAPLAAPSANPFGYISPAQASHVVDSFGDKVPFVLDGGPCDIGIESTILDFTDPQKPEILRLGAVSAESLAELLGKRVPIKNVTLHHGEAAAAPGTFSRHYSPDTRLVLFEEGTPPTLADHEAMIWLKRPSKSTSENEFWFSEDGDSSTIAKALFSLLRTIDQQQFTRVFCEVPPATSSGLGLAIRDRLTRAACQK